MPSRTPIPADLVADVLLASRRRCCICFALTNSFAERKGQIAHLDHDASNNSIENLVFLCLEHHDQYDSRTSQSKGLTVEEVRLYRARLDAFIARPLALPKSDTTETGHFSVWHQKRIDALVAIYEAFRTYLVFLRRALYIPGEGLPLDPMWDFRNTLERNMVFLNDSLQRDIQRFSSELQYFWNWAHDQTRPGGIDETDPVQQRLDYEIPEYLEKLRQVINSYSDPNFRTEEPEAQPVAPLKGGSAVRSSSSGTSERPPSVS
jgi:hypothetical protein